MLSIRITGTINCEEQSDYLTTYHSIINTAIASANLTGMYTTTANITIQTDPNCMAGDTYVDQTAFKTSCSASATGICGIS